MAVLGLSLASHAANLQIGAFVGSASDTSLDGSYPQPTQKNVAAFAALQGRPLDYVQLYCIWPATWSTVKSYADIAANNGATLLVTWQPNGYTAPDINSGTADAYITQFANDIKSYPHDVWLRPLHEANGGDWYSWNVGNSSMLNTNANVAAAFQHIVTLFRNAGVTNVKWVWTTNGTNASGGNPTSFAGTYPGDAYADYISIDGYNFGTFHTIANSGWTSSWQTFAQVFSAPYTAISSINKPMFVGEFSSSELGGDKAQWYKDAFASLATTFPKLFALMVFSLNDANGDWRINTTAASLQAWRDCVAQYAATTSIASRGIPTSGNFLQARGPSIVGLNLDKATRVRVSVRDGSGSLLESRDLGMLAAGSHELDLGTGRGMRFVRVQAGSRSETLPIAGF
ncbi:MAG TPA: glycosyl hydrolase [Fibrobacteria bacterium]|nr:glycosyl hydrolase [Fibrobacteria bacterium]